MARRRSRAVGAAGTATFAAAALALGGCASQDPDYQGVCVNQSTNQRVDDETCRSGGGGHGFFFFPIGRAYPAVGSSVAGFTGGVGAVPDGHVGVMGGAAASGGTVSAAGAKSAVSRGGFGTTGKGGSVGG